jgi:hypothetical protein
MVIFVKRDFFENKSLKLTFLVILQFNLRLFNVIFIENLGNTLFVLENLTISQKNFLFYNFSIFEDNTLKF